VTKNLSSIETNPKDEVVRSPLRTALLACKSSFITVGVFSFFINMLMLTPMFFMMQVFDRVVASGSLSSLVALAVIAVFLLSTMGVLEWIRSRVLVKVATRLDLLLSDKVYHECFAYGRLQQGANSVQPLNDLNGLRQYLGGNAIFAFFDLPWLPFYMVLMFVFHPIMGFWGVFAAVVLVVLAVANERTTRKPLEEANDLARISLAHTDRNLRNAEVVSSMGMLQGLHSRWRSRQNTTLYHQEISSNYAGGFMAFTKTFRIIAQMGAMGLGALLTVTQMITPGTMIAGSLLMSRALSPLESMISAWKSFTTARQAYQRLEAMLDVEENQSDYTRMPDPEGRVSAHDVTIVPPKGKYATIQGVSFDIPPGSVVGIIGPSGAGKTTLVRGILGTWGCAEGAFRIDGVETTQYRREDLGPHLGYLPQDIELFDGTISENIARFESVDSEAVVTAAKDAGVHQLILDLPEGYDTVIGSDGYTLSAGQRQRIALARAVYRRPQIVILDEPNSNLDDAGEAALHRTILRLRKQGSTVLVVSHRKPILGLTNILLFMVGGRLEKWGQRGEVLQWIEDETNRLRAARDAESANPSSISANTASEEGAATEAQESEVKHG
jgi:ATP-binding cassette subfamily C protein EexD